MNADLHAAGEARRKTRKTVLSMIGGGVVGFVGAAVMIALIDLGYLGKPDPSVFVALLIALVYGLIGLIVIVGIAAPNAGARFLNVEDAEEILEQKPSLVSSGWSMVIMGLTLGVIAVGGSGGILTPLAALAIAMVLMAAGTFLSLQSMRHADELMRALTIEATQMSYYLLFAVMGGWAMVAHFGLVPGPSMLDLLSAFWAFMLIATFWVAGRRGMLKQR